MDTGIHPDCQLSDSVYVYIQFANAEQFHYSGNKMEVLKISAFLATTLLSCCGEGIDNSKVFIVKIDPALFNWTDNYHRGKFQYRASLENNPDLPGSISYLYSERHQAGFLYGVPPPNQPEFTIQLLGINKSDYEVRQKILHFNVTEKTDQPKYEVHLKIDNMNVEDLFETHRLERLLNVFVNILWKSSKDYLHVTFLASAVKLGARLPLRPFEGEGVVVHLGSGIEFSEELINLQEEVKPLWKFSSCPRDFKRTTVDRHFRSVGFLLDWCSFRLVKLESESGNAHYKEAEMEDEGASGWELPARESVPSRNYIAEVSTTLIVPTSTLVFLWIFVSLILCFQHEKINDVDSDRHFDSLFNGCQDCFSTRSSEDSDLTIAQYEAVQRATDTLRSMGSKRDTETSPRLTSERLDTCRPHPPPYSTTKKSLLADS